MSEMIERVAKVMAALSQLQWEFMEDGILGRDEDDWECRVFWRKLARAAIEAMREPTKAMINSGFAADPLACDVEIADDGYPPVFRAMIAEALKP